MFWRAKPRPVIKWEYFSLSIPLHERAAVTCADLLSDYGAGGWELVAVAVYNGHERYHFKRPRVEKVV